MTAPGFSASAGEASETRSPEPPGHDRIHRAEALLRSASLLLAGNDSPAAAHALHVALAGELDRPPPEVYTSQRQAEDVHRQLGDELTRQRSQAHPAFWHTLRSRPLLARRLPQWLAWVAICTVVAFLFLRYAYAIYGRWRWQEEHPEGPWISRYYGTRSFRNYVLTRYDVGVDYDWGNGPPAEAMARDNWAGRWDTCLVVKSHIKLKLRLTADDAAKLWVDDQLLSTIRRASTKTVPIDLRPGTHHFRLEYQERKKRAKLSLQGLVANGNDIYSFQRPRLEGEQVHCDPPR
ncbi:MAG: hypothetical protein RL685_4051 [Pseudomonadota bacterium]|jgi:hypothetical protein